CTAKPIKCLEATVLGIYFTASIPTIKRFSIRFKTSAYKTRYYWHIVCCLQYQNKYGSVGLSRRNELGGKDIIYTSLSDLIYNYILCYCNIGHTVHTFNIGLPINYDEHSIENVYWNFLHFDI